MAETSTLTSTIPYADSGYVERTKLQDASARRQRLVYLKIGERNASLNGRPWLRRTITGFARFRQKHIEPTELARPR